MDPLSLKVKQDGLRSLGEKGGEMRAKLSLTSKSKVIREVLHILYDDYGDGDSKIYWNNLDGEEDCDDTKSRGDDNRIKKKCRWSW